MPPPGVAANEDLRPGDADEQDRRAHRVDERLEQLERIVVRPLQVVEHEDGRVGPLRRVDLEEALDDGPAHRADLLRVALDRADERRALEVEIQQLPEEIRDVADLAIVEDVRQLRSYLRLGGADVGPLDDAEAGAKDTGEDLVRGSAFARRAAKDAGGGPSLPRPDEKIAHEAGLADARRADDGHRVGELLLRREGVRALELLHLRRLGPWTSEARRSLTENREE